ncbi:hypothetical protein CMI37_36795 [Candidatus Pacearchaeota archaeon]|nr:hypothetical protein [Candidatus Pacearchaeota archaeon]|tara:strand:+ start:2542 stop:2859 length:318 start_codon:yes stop_codon:yes gene_type:complete
MNKLQREAIMCLSLTLRPKKHRGQVPVARELAIAVWEYALLGFWDKLFKKTRYRYANSLLDAALSDYTSQQIEQGKRRIEGAASAGSMADLRGGSHVCMGGPLAG